MDELGQHIAIFTELARGNSVDPEVGSQFLFEDRELAAGWDERTPNVRKR
jgi:hypothetical protein